MERGLPKELTTLIVRSGPPAKAGLGPARGGLVARGSRAPPDAVPRVAFACATRATMAGSSAKASTMTANSQAAV